MFGKSFSFFEIEQIQIGPFEIEQFQFDPSINKLYYMSYSIRKIKLIISSKRLYKQNCLTIKAGHVIFSLSKNNILKFIIL